MNDFVTSIITTVSIAVILPVVFNVFYFLKRKEEKKLAADNVNSFRTRAPKVIKIFFLGAAIIFFVAGIIGAIIAIVDKAGLFTVLVVLGCCTIFSFIGLVGYLLTLNYEIVNGDTITVVRCFKKRKIIKIGDIACYQYIESYIGGLKVFDKNGVVLFGSEYFNLNLNRLVGVLESNFIQRVDGKTYPDATIKANPFYKRYIKKHNFLIIAWTLFGFGLSTILLFALIFPQRHNWQFENYRISGVISEYEVSGKFIKIKLDDDECTYCINNIVYDEMNPYFMQTISVGESFDFLIGYTDDSGRRNISQVEKDGVIFLDKFASEKAEKDNYKGTTVMSWVFLGLGCALIAGWLPCIICSLKIKVEND